MAATSALLSSSELAEAMHRALSVICIDEKKEPVLEWCKRYFCNAVEDTNSIDAVQRIGQRTQEVFGMHRCNLSTKQTN